MNDTSEARLQQVYPGLAAKVRALADELAQEGIEIVVVQALRTVEQQDALFAQGRTAPGKIVTDAPGGHSWHNFGLAVDCAPENVDGSIDWNGQHPQWKSMEAMGVGVGMVSGANWKRIVDAPHFQLNGGWPVGGPDDEVRQLYASGGLQAVWAALEAFDAAGKKEA